MRLLAAAALTALLASAGELRIERVFGPEVPTGRYKHPASMEALANGDLYLVYYGGAGEYALNTGVFGARLRKGETWLRWPVLRCPPRDCLRADPVEIGYAAELWIRQNEVFRLAGNGDQPLPARADRQTRTEQETRARFSRMPARRRATGHERFRAAGWLGDDEGRRNGLAYRQAATARVG